MTTAHPPAPPAPGRHRRPLYDLIVSEHRDMRDRLRALNQAAHDGHGSAEVEAVRRVLWVVSWVMGRAW